MNVAEYRPPSIDVSRSHAWPVLSKNKGTMLLSGALENHVNMHRSDMARVKSTLPSGVILFLSLPLSIRICILLNPSTQRARKMFRSSIERNTGRMFASMRKTTSRSPLRRYSRLLPNAASVIARNRDRDFALPMRQLRSLYVRDIPTVCGGMSMSRRALPPARARFKAYPFRRCFPATPIPRVKSRQ